MGVPQLDRTQREVYKQLVRTAVASRQASREAGVSQERLDLLPAWHELDAFGDPERAALRLAETLTRLDDGDERAAATAAATDHFSDEQLSALEWTIVLINAFNRVSIASHHQPGIED